MGAFTLQLSEFAKKAGANAEQVVRKVGIEVLSSVVRKSPVDTGRFRANWQVGLAEVGTIRNAVDPTGTTTISLGSQKINVTALGQSIWISNSLPYAARLERGYSKQAPAGMVGLTVIEFNDFVRNALRQLP